jgi:hypothetical protein
MRVHAKYLMKLSPSAFREVSRRASTTNLRNLDAQPRRPSRSSRRSDRPGCADRRLLRDLARCLQPRPEGGVRHFGPSRLQPGRRLQRDAHPGHHPGRSRLPRASRGTTVRSSSAATPMASPSPPGRRRSRCWPPTTSPCWSTPGRLHADPGGLARDHPAPTAVHQARRLADGIVRDPVAQPAARRRLQVQPAAAVAPPTADATSAIAARANELIPGPGRREARPLRAARAAGRVRLPGPYVDDLPTSSTSRRSSAAGVRIGADPLGGAAVAYWGAIAERHGLDLTVMNPLVDPTLALHDARLGRQDPDGLLVRLGDGVADRDHEGRTPRTYDMTSPPATTPTPTGTASSRRTPG